MKVKIGDQIYDSEEEPIMIILSDHDKKNIANMNADCSKFCSFPDDELYTEDKIRKFMKMN